MKRERGFDIEELEEEWTCPITSMPMKNPVILEDGHSYEQKDIAEWLQRKKISPKTNLQIKREPIPNIALRNVIQKYQKEIKYQTNKLKTQNAQLLQQLHSYQIGEFKRQINEKKGNLTNLPQDENLQKKYNNLKRQLDNLKIYYNNLEAQLKEQKEKKSQHQKLINQKNQILLRDKKQNNKQFQIINNDKQSQLRVLIQSDIIKAENNQLCCKILKINQQNEKLHNQLIQLKGEYDWLKIQHEKFKKQLNENLTIKDDFLKNQSQKIEKKYEQMKLNPASICDQEKPSNNQALIQLAEANQLIKKLKQENQELNKALNPHDQNSKKIAQLMKKLQQKKRQAEILTLQKNKLVRKIQEFKVLQANHQSFKKHYEQEIFKITDQRAQVQKQRLRIDNFEVEKKNVRRIQRLQTQNEVLVQTNKFKNNQIENLRSQIIRQSVHIQEILPQLHKLRSQRKEMISEFKIQDILMNKLQKQLFKIECDLKNKQQMNKIKAQFIQKSIPTFQQQPNKVHSKQFEKQNKSKLSNLMINEQHQVRKINTSEISAQNKFVVKQQQQQKSLLNESKVMIMPQNFKDNSSRRQIDTSQQQQSTKLNTTLKYQKYLAKYPIIYNKSKSQLNHTGYEVNMQDFLQYDWSKIQKINFKNCKINNQKFKMFVNESKKFPNLIYLLLWNNEINDLPNKCFDGFVSLKGVYLSIKGGLNQKSKNYLDSFKKRNPQVQIICQVY